MEIRYEVLCSVDELSCFMTMWAQSITEIKKVRERFPPSLTERLW